MTATVSVWTFETEDGASSAVARLEQLRAQGALVVHDAVVLTWVDGEGPKTRQVRSLTGAGALGGSFWGLLVGSVVLMPLLGAAIGAASGAAGAALGAVGIHETFLRDVRAGLRPGTSALFLMTSEAIMDRVRDAFDGERATLVRTTLDAEQEERLREVFQD